MKPTEPDNGFFLPSSRSPWMVIYRKVPTEPWRWAPVAFSMRARARIHAYTLRVTSGVEARTVRAWVPIESN